MRPGIILLAATAFFLGFTLASTVKAENAPWEDRWPNKFDDTVRHHLEWKDIKLADDISDWIDGGLYVAPLVYALSNGEERWKRAGVAASALLINKGVTSGLKAYFGRTRPNGLDTRAMPSGHASSAFAGAGLVCAMARDSYSCPTAVFFASSVAYLRIAARKHWATDVLAGAALGWVNGRLVPTLYWSW